jgi:hypothetical protein
VLQRLDDGFLDQIGGVGGVTGPPRKATGGPAAKDRNVVIEQAIERFPVSGAGAQKQIDRVIGVVRLLGSVRGSCLWLGDGMIEQISAAAQGILSTRLVEDGEHSEPVRPTCPP